MAKDQAETERARSRAQATELQTLNFKVPLSFKRAFKVYAAQNGITMLELLKEGFELSKHERGGHQ